MARTDKKVRYSPDRKDRGHTPSSAAEGVAEAALKNSSTGRWKLVILFHLFDGKLLRFSELDAGDSFDLTKDVDLNSCGSWRMTAWSAGSCINSGAAKGRVWPNRLG